MYIYKKKYIMYSHILWKLSQSINKKIIVTLKLDIKLQLRDIKSQLWEIELQLLFFWYNYKLL